MDRKQMLNYPILIESGLLQQPKRWLPKKFADYDLVIITDHLVKKYYGKALADALKKADRKVLLLTFPAGESSKNQKVKTQLEEHMLRKKCGRNTLCLALGGGVVTDLAGFIAATYMRGIPVIQIPTSLLAMVDSSIGGKTAINTDYGKNLLGAFWQPQAVIVDVDCLRSLPRQHLINGLIEAAKMFLTHDRRSFRYLQKRLKDCLSGDEKMLRTIIKRAIAIKKKIVAQDEREQHGLRQTLNFGHTIGHALEKLSDYQMLHGYAVAYGILVEAKIAELKGLLASADYAEIAALFAAMDIFPQDLDRTMIKKIRHAIKYDKKNRAGESRYVLLKTIGQVYSRSRAWVHPISDPLLIQAWREVTGEHNAWQ
jgi:3-dehydroquinate synthase